jgi:hypothetical protein
MKVLWNFTSSFLLPMAVLLSALSFQGVPLDSNAALAVVVSFMVLKVAVQHFKFEPGRAIFAGAGREGQFRVYAGMVYSIMALGAVQLFGIATH